MKDRSIFLYCEIPYIGKIFILSDNVLGESQRGVYFLSYVLTWSLILSCIVTLDLVMDCRRKHYQPWIPGWRGFEVDNQLCASFRQKRSDRKRSIKKSILKNDLYSATTRDNKKGIIQKGKIYLNQPTCLAKTDFRNF